MQPLVVFDDSGLLTIPWVIMVNTQIKSNLRIYHGDWSKEGQQGSGTYAYTANSDLLATLTRGTRVTTYTYEPTRDLKSQVRNQVGATTVSQYAYINDAIGRRTSVVNTGTGFAASAFNLFGYNTRSELTGSNRYLGTNIAVLTSPVPAETRAFTYDPIGNRTNMTVGTTAGTYTANNLNQYASQTGPANTFTHDFDGNLAQITGTRNVVLTYDGENRLVTVQPVTPVANNKKLDFVYDYQGRRVQKIVSNRSGSSWVVQTTKRFVYDGWNMVEEQTVSGTTKYYVYGLDLSQSLQGAGGVGGLLAKAEGAATHQYFYDANGNISQMINASSGAIDARYEYDAYGNSILATGTQAAGNTMRFSTKYLDTEYTLYYYGYRYYDPATGRWVNRDPLEEDGGLLLYGFNLNDPINNYDADGRAVETGWDLFNVGSGLISLGCNVASGNVVGALVDGVGLLYDAAATTVPGLPGGAHTVIELYRAGSIAPKMYRFLEANQTARNVYRFAVRKGVDEAHHIIPRGGSPINWTNKALRKQMDVLRARARKLGFDIDGAENGVALPAEWHKNNTFGEFYYRRVVNLFGDAKTRDEFSKRSSILAEQLLKESGKVK